jgi:hypothetical protein
MRRQQEFFSLGRRRFWHLWSLAKVVRKLPLLVSLSIKQFFDSRFIQVQQPIPAAVFAAPGGVVFILNARPLLFRLGASAAYYFLDTRLSQQIEPDLWGEKFTPSSSRFLLHS